MKEFEERRKNNQVSKVQSREKAIRKLGRRLVLLNVQRYGSILQAVENIH